MTNSSSDKGRFPVAGKVFMRDGDKLLIVHDIFKDWDLPGGRILPHEFPGDIHAVIERKISEELGDDIKYEVEDLPETYFQVIRKEHDTGEESCIFAIGFTAKYLGGEIKLGPNHDKYEWVDMNTLVPTDYFAYGWETGVDRYLKHHGFIS